MPDSKSEPRILAVKYAILCSSQNYLHPRLFLHHVPRESFSSCNCVPGLKFVFLYLGLMSNVSSCDSSCDIIFNSDSLISIAD